MAFVKERITDEDRAAYAAKGVNISQYDERWSIDREKDAFLIKIGQDRYDIGGTTHEWWWFYYQGLSLRITCDVATRPDREKNPNRFELPIIKIEHNKYSERKEILFQELSPDWIELFLFYFNKAYKNYHDYGDIFIDELTENSNFIYECKITKRV